MDHMGTNDKMVTESPHGMSGMDTTGSGHMTGNSSHGGGEHHSGHTFEITDAEIYFEAVLLIITIIVGVLANSLALAAMAYNKKMRSGVYVLFANLSITGLLIAVLCMPFHVTSILMRAWTLGDVACEMEGHLIALCALVTLVTHTEIAIVRNAAGVAAPHVYRKLASRTGTILLTVGAWVVAGLIQGLGIGIGIVLSEYSALYSRCTPINMARLIDLLIASAVIIIGFYAVICFCYAQLFLVIKRRIHALNMAKSGKNEKFLKVTKALLALSVLFIVCWLPFLIICAIDPAHDQLRVSLHRFGHDFAEILSCINPIFYFLRIDEFKKAIRKMLHMKEPSEESVTSHTGSTAKTAVSKVRKTAEGDSGKTLAPPQPVLVSVTQSERGDPTDDR